MAEKSLQTAREEFNKILAAHKDGYGIVIEMSDPPEDIDAEEWPDDAYRLIDSTLEVLMAQEEPT